jgi:hypothetical protein
MRQAGTASKNVESEPANAGAPPSVRYSSKNVWKPP